MKKSFPGLTFALLVAISAAPAGAQTAPAGSVQDTVGRVAPSIVTVKMVLKTEFKSGGQAQDMESRTEDEGVVVTADGLVMLSNGSMSTDRLQELMGGGDGDMGFKITPTEFKVIIEREEKEYSAFLVATDNNLGLAFVQIEDLAGRKLPTMDFGPAVDLAEGQKVMQVARLSKGYDYAPYYATAEVSGEISKPRKAWMLDGSLAGMGLPVLTQAGQPAGVLTTISSGVKEDQPSEAMGLAMMMRFFGGGGGTGLLHVFVVPADPVRAAIAAAKVREVEVAAQRAKAKATAPPAPPAKPSQPPKKPAGTSGKGG